MRILIFQIGFWSPSVVGEKEGATYHSIFVSSQHPLRSQCLLFLALTLSRAYGSWYPVASFTGLNPPATPMTMETSRQGNHKSRVLQAGVRKPEDCVLIESSLLKF